MGPSLPEAGAHQTGRRPSSLGYSSGAGTRVFGDPCAPVLTDDAYIRYSFVCHVTRTFIFILRMGLVSSKESSKCNEVVGIV